MKRAITLLSILLHCSIVISQNGADFYETNQIKALISPVANHFWDYDDSQYFIPKDSGTQSIFTSTFWIGGKDDSDQLHVSAERFRGIGRDFLEGPYSSSGDYDTTFTSPWYRVWVVKRDEIEHWINNPNQVSTPQAVLDWPAHGDSTAGQAANLAPFVDVNNDGVYDPVNDFDYPKFKGDQAVLFMFNDDGILNTESGGDKMGIEAIGMAYGFNCATDTALNNTLFMEYTITNRSNINYNDCYVGLWNDFDLGNPQDDYVGCDPTRNLFFAYQGDNEDEDAQGKQGYLFNIPAQGVRVIDGIAMDDDGIDNTKALDSSGNYYGFGMEDGTIDNEKLGLSHFMYHNNSPGPTGDPSIAIDYYNYMRGIWRDGTTCTYGGNGYDPANPNALPSRFMFPGSSDTNNYGTYGVSPVSSTPWQEDSAGNTPADRRGMGSIGPFSLESSDTRSFTIAYVFAQKMNDRHGAVDKMKSYSDQVQSMYDSGTTPCGKFEPDPIIGIDDEVFSEIQVYPNPAQYEVVIRGLQKPHAYSIHDMKGRLISKGHVSPQKDIIDVSQLAAGAYAMSLIGTTTNQTHQLIIHH